jgi:hypothetical protein
VNEASPSQWRCCLSELRALIDDCGFQLDHQQHKHKEKGGEK